MGLKTPLYDCHVKHGGKIVPFAGYLLPVQYTQGLIKEHLAVRENCGLFDVSHMSEMFVEGPDALRNIQMLFPNDFAVMHIGQVRYSTMLGEGGGIIDDMIVCKFADDRFMIVGNGANRQKDHDWIAGHVSGDCRFINRSDEYAQIAIQGPNSTDVLKQLTTEENIPAKYYTFLKGKVAGVNCIISQTGYTGEMGYELYASPDKAAALWEALMEAGAAYGLIPCGLGARDTLRLEASMVLYGHEMSDDITPLEAKLDFSVKLGKDNFIGKAALEARMDSTRTLACFKVTGKGIVRENCELFIGGEKVGVSTSGTYSPFFGYPIAMGYIEKEHSGIGTAVQFDVRGRQVEAEIVKAPFYKRNK